MIENPWNPTLEKIWKKTNALPVIFFVILISAFSIYKRSQRIIKRKKVRTTSELKKYNTTKYKPGVSNG